MCCFDHLFQIANAAFIAVQFLLCSLVFVILTEIAEGTRPFDFLQLFGKKLFSAMLQLLFHLLNILLCQFIMHGIFLSR